uniref:DUF11 domain-containing protein n=1 Tax=candidate division WOR-3 bacterium TaxID=2052148 RepID=A0A7C4CDV1_UNCW3
MTKRLLGVVLLSALLPASAAGYGFSFVCRSDTSQRVEPGGVAEFVFSLTNTGAEPDIYEFDCRVVQAVSGWAAIYCLGGRCYEPGVPAYDTLAAGQADTTIGVSVYTSSTAGEEVVRLRASSLGAPTLTDSITIRTMAGSGVAENGLAGFCHRAPARLVRGAVFVVGAGTVFTSCGRLVAKLRPDWNDMRHLAAGVYVVRPVPGSSFGLRRLVVVK